MTGTDIARGSSEGLLFGSIAAFYENQAYRRADARPVAIVLSVEAECDRVELCRSRRARTDSRWPCVVPAPAPAPARCHRTATALVQTEIAPKA